MKKLVFILVVLAFALVNADVVHIVEKGECLSKIAKEYGVSLGRLLDMNPELKNNPDLIHPGDKVVVAKEETMGFVTDGFFCVIIERGDQLGLIAKRFNVEIDTLVILNSIEDPDLIFAGDTLRICPVTITEAEPERDEFVDPFTATIMAAEQLGPFVEFGEKSSVHVFSEKTRKFIETVLTKPIIENDSVLVATISICELDAVRTDSATTDRQAGFVHSQFLSLLGAEMRPVFILGALLCLFAATAIKREEKKR
ncbi:MAG: LysM peptidoglycan-binding domain-containing protein [Candidatus Heimdallarchaeaceae archaeon]